MGGRRFIRLRVLLDRRYTVVVIGLLVLAGIGAWGVYATHVAPETETDERVVSSWSGAGEFEHGATVTNGTEAFPEGERVTNRPVYFTNATPTLDGAYTYQYDASDGELDAHTALELEIRSVGEADDEEEEEVVYWQMTEPLGEERTSALGPGDTHELPFEIDVGAIDERVETIEEELDSSPGEIELLVTAHTTIEGSVAGEGVEESYEHDLRIDTDDATYEIDGPATHEEVDETVEQATVPVEHGPLRSVGSVLLLLGSLLGLGAVVGADRQGMILPAGERTRVEHERRRAEFDDWISRGRLPPELRDRPRVDVESLEELVDVAIDSDRRVIEEASSGSYYVVDDGVVYAYGPESEDQEPAESAEGTD